MPFKPSQHGKYGFVDAALFLFLYYGDNQYNLGD